MNNYISFETIDLAKKLKGYNMLFNYRMSNLCVKAEPTALMPVTVFVAGTEYNLEDVANILRPDDFSFDVYPKNPNNLQAIIDGVFDMHPEFKMEMKSEKNANDEETHHVVYTMPEVNKDRRDVLNETSKAFHQECLSKLDACYAKELADTAEAFTKMSVPEVDEAKTGFKNIYDDAKEQSEKLLNAKLTEIEEGYQRYLSQQGESSQGDGNHDFSKSIHLGQYEE